MCTGMRDLEVRREEMRTALAAHWYRNYPHFHPDHYFDREVFGTVIALFGNVLDHALRCAELFDAGRFKVKVVAFCPVAVRVRCCWLEA